MRKNLFAGILIFMISTNIFAKDLVVATYDNGKEVKDSEIMMKYSALSSQPQFKGKKFTELDPRLQEALIKNYITDILVTEEAKKSNIQDSKAFKEKIEYIKLQLPKEMFLEQIMQKSISDKQIDEEYNKIVKELKGKKRIKVSHILIADEKTAKEAKGKIDKGSSFIEICQQYSIDANSKVNACSLGVLNQGQLVEEFEKVAFSMKIGTISEPVKTQFGWHIIKLDDKLDSIIPPKAELVEAIKDNIYKKALEQYINNLLTQFKVQITLPKQTMQEIKN
jgi:parvulin-like peptidyl-prolyl isomerase